MKTPSSHPDQTLLLNLTMAVVLLPFFVAFAALVCLTRRVDCQWVDSGTLWEQCILYLFGFTVPSVALILVLWKGWSRGPLILLILSYMGLGLQRLDYSPDNQKRIDLAFGRSGQPGLDVFCNGEHLGKTPFLITDEQFHQKVSTWTKPPRQDRLQPSESGLEWAKFTWVPKDFTETGRWPPTRELSCLSDEKKKLEVIKSCPYWWRFESNGHQALGTVANFGGGGGGMMNRMKINITAQLTFPALQPHLALVIDGLLAEKEPPSPAWIAHFRKYQNLLFLPFFEKAKSDPRLRNALDAVARAEYDIPDNPTPADCERVLVAILDRVEAYGFFQIPSLESIAIDLLGNAATESVVRHYRIKSPDRISDSGQSSSDSYVVRYRTGRAVRLFPLEYAVKRIRPPELFNLLVYRWGQAGNRLDLVGCYENQKAADLLAEYLRDSGRNSGRRYSVEGALPTIVEILNPAVQEHLKNFVRENGAGSPFHHHYITQFVKSRIGVPGINQAELASWVYHWAPFDEREKLDLLTRINSPCVATFLNIMRPVHDDMKWTNVLYILADRPNPSLAQVLIDAYLGVKEPPNVVYECPNLVKAIIRTDTPAVRKFLGAQLQDQTSRAKLLQRLTVQDKADLARLAWLTPSIEKVTDPASKTQAAKLLASFRTPEADKLLDCWAAEGNDEVRKAVQRQREEQKKDAATHAARLQQWSDLLAGKIQPEDLVPPQKPWHWDGTQYVQEK